MQKKVLNNPKITVLFDTIVKEIKGENKLQSIICQNVRNGKTFKLPVDGLFLGLGQNPNTGIFKKELAMDSKGYLKKGVSKAFPTMTSKMGVFVAGDASDARYRQAVVACGEGCQAALDANEFLDLLQNTL